MQESRDSSVLRSLAVAFGDGLAFGVGMKLARNAVRPPGAEPLAEGVPLAGRLDRLEERMAHLELAPPPAPAAPAGFDRKVVEAVVNALEARIDERAAQVERRLDDLQARTEPVAGELAELRSRVAENERTTLDLLLAIGQLCRHAALRGSAGVEDSEHAAAGKIAP